MSTAFGLLAENASGTAYVVAAPHPGDALRLTLRTAFSTEDRGSYQLNELMSKLNAVDFQPRR